MTRRPRVPRPDPRNLELEGEVFRRELEREAERSLRDDPERWRHVRAGSPNPHREKPNHCDTRGTPL
jgi:hypothetical protein